MFFLYILYVLIFALIGKYFYSFFRRIAKLLKVNVNNKFCKMLLILLCIIIIALCINLSNFWIIIFLHLLFYCLIIDLIMHVISKKIDNKKIRNIYNSGLIPVFLTAMTLIYAHWNMANVIETNYTIYTDKNLNSEYKVVAISDLHFEVNMNSSKLKKYKNHIDKLNPDFVILAGDIVDENTSKEGMQNAFSILGDIKSKYGIFFVYGNHDKSNYRSNKSYSVEELERAINEAGIITLTDEAYELNEDITLIGRIDASFSRDTPRESSESLISNLDKEKFLFMIDHQPIDLKENARLGYDLQISGHTHGGQIFPIGMIDNLLKINEMNYGYRKIDSFQVIVSSGMAGWAYPFRTENHSEYVVINIKNT